MLKKEKKPKTNQPKNLIKHKDPYVLSSDLILLLPYSVTITLIWYLFVLHEFLYSNYKRNCYTHTFLKGFSSAEYSYSQYTELLF